MTEQGCIFCQIVSGTLAAPKVWENDQVLAFKDLNPSADTHILIVPKTHIQDFLSVSDLAVLDGFRQAAQELIRENNLTGAYKLIFNGGSYQHVPHLHWHLLGGKLTGHL